MSVIESLQQTIVHQLQECSEEAARVFHSSVRPIFASLDGTRPELIGSCFLLYVDGTKYVVTAAHIVDWTATHAIYVGGTVGTQPVQIVGEIKSTREPSGGRKNDKFDCAFWKVSADAERELGAVTFLDDSRVSRNQVSRENRFYLSMGYPVSRNKGNISNAKRTIQTALSKYTGQIEEIPALAKKLNVSGAEHFFLKFAKFSGTANGEKVSSFKPQGVSGGALIDLGNFATIEKFSPGSKHAGYLSGMMIEHHPDHRALVAVRIEYVLNAIRSQRAL